MSEIERVFSLSLRKNLPFVLLTATLVMPFLQVRTPRPSSALNHEICNPNLLRLLAVLA